MSSLNALEKLTIGLGAVIILMFFDFWVYHNGQYVTEWWWVPWMITLVAVNIIVGVATFATVEDVLFRWGTW